MLARKKYVGTGEITGSDARAELERLLADPRFRATHRARNVLIYLAKRAFKGHTEGVKAYAIALDVLGRPSSFDPNSDPIVRIEISRLRAALGTYYSVHQEETQIRIDLPVGRYLVEFSRTDSGVRPEQSKAKGGMSPEPAASGYGGGLILRLLASATAMSVVVIVSGTWVWREQDLSIRLTPFLSLSVSAAEEDHEDEAQLLKGDLMTAISRFQTVMLIPSLRSSSESIELPVISPLRKNYQASLKYYRTGRESSILWQISDGRRGNILASGIEKVSAAGPHDVAARERLVSALAKNFAASRGTIGKLELYAENLGDEVELIGDRCLLWAEYVLNEGSQSSMAAARRCLEMTLESSPGNAQAAAVLARVLLESGEPANVPAALRRADQLALYAVSIEPSTDRARLAIMLTRLHQGRAEAAIEAGKQAISLNPNNPEILAGFSLVLFISGFRDAAVSLAQKASLDIDAAPRNASLVLALDAYRRGEFSNASLIAEQIVRVDVLVAALRAAALGELGSGMAPTKLLSLSELFPDYRSGFNIWISQRAYGDELAAALQRGLVKAEKLFETDSAL